METYTITAKLVNEIQRGNCITGGKIIWGSVYDKVAKYEYKDNNLFITELDGDEAILPVQYYREITIQKNKQ